MENTPLIQDTEEYINEYTHRKRRCNKKINWSYVLFLTLLIASVVFNILIFVYLNKIIGEIYYYKDQINDKIKEEHIKDYSNKLKKVIDYFCDDMIKC